jgi:hypothetical protein
LFSLADRSELIIKILSDFRLFKSTSELYWLANETLSLYSYLCLCLVFTPHIVTDLGKNKALQQEKTGLGEWWRMNECNCMNV